MSVAQNLLKIKESLSDGVQLVAVSKFHPVEVLKEAYDAGQRIFGESRAQELCMKRSLLPEDIEWHFIGSLQTNKVKDIVPFVKLIHSVDSLKLLKEIHKQALKCNRVVDVLLEIHIAAESTKHGFTPDEVVELLQSASFKELTQVRIKGVMGMATNVDDEEQIRKEFRLLHDMFVKIKHDFFEDGSIFDTLSMGMSDDYRIAMAEGSTMVRIGTTIFGEREY